MGSGCVADLVHTLHYGVQCRVVADRGVRAVQVIVDGARESNYRELEFIAEKTRSGKGAVTADHHKGIYAVAAENIVCALPALRGLEFLAACCLKNCTAALDDVRYVLGGELLDFIVNEAVVAAVDTVHLEAGIDGRARNRADRRVHARSVSSGGENPDGSDVIHESLLTNC